MIGFMVTGLVLGLSAGISPGPLMALVISETLQHDIKAGIKVALAPIITDAPIIFLTLLLSASLSEFNVILGLISLAGGIFVLFLALSSFRVRSKDIEIKAGPSRTLQKGILVNALSPHPYLFWFTVGAPIMTKAMNARDGSVVGFIGAFYVLLVGSKIMLAVIAGKSKSLMTGRGYIFIMRALGIILCLFSVILFKDSLVYFGIL